MSNQLKIATYRPVLRSTNLVGCYPCFQAVADGTQMLDRAGGAANNAAFGSALVASAAWATPGVLTTAYSATGTVAGVPFLTAAQQQSFVWGTDSMLVAGWYSCAVPAANSFLVGNGSATNVQGFALRVAPTTGFVTPIVYGASSLFGTASAASVATGSAKHLAVLIDGPARRLHVWIDGAYDALNGSTVYGPGANGLNFGASAIVGTTQANVLQIGGAPNTGSASQTAAGSFSLSIGGTYYGWQVGVRKAAAPPVEMQRLISRLLRHPLQPLSQSEW